MEGLLIVIGLVGLFGGLFCAFREKKVTSLYKSYGVYGRFKAYLFFDFAFTGILFPITTILTAKEQDAGVKEKSLPYLRHINRRFCLRAGGKSSEQCQLCP